MADEDTNLSTEAGTQEIKAVDDEPAISTTVPQKSEEADIEESGDGPSIKFEESTHQYLIYGFDSGSRDINSLIMGFGLWVIQMTLYSLLFQEAITQIEESQVEVTVGAVKCTEVHSRGNGKIGAINVSNNIMTCANPAEGPESFYALLPVTLLAINLQPDFVQCLGFIFGRKSHCMKKLMAAIVLSEGFFGLLTGLVWVWQGILKGSGYDAIVNSIGVLFIHDLDEQLFASIEALNDSPITNLFHKVCKEGCCCHNFAAMFCTGIFTGFVIGLAFLVRETMYDNYDSADAAFDATFYENYPIGYYEDGYGEPGFTPDLSELDWWDASYADQFDSYNSDWASGGDTNTGGDSVSGADSNSGGDTNTGGDSNFGGDTNTGYDTNTGGDSNYDSNY